MGTKITGSQKWLPISSASKLQVLPPPGGDALKHTAEFVHHFDGNKMHFVACLSKDKAPCPICQAIVEQRRKRRKGLIKHHMFLFNLNYEFYKYEWSVFHLTGWSKWIDAYFKG